MGLALFRKKALVTPARVERQDCAINNIIPITMGFRRASGRTKVMYFPKPSAVTLPANIFMKFATPSTGVLARAISDTGEAIVGVLRDSYASTDTTENRVPIEVPLEKWVEWEFDTDSDGGLTDTHVGQYLDLDTTGGNVDVSASTDDAILVTKRISATKGLGVLVKDITDLSVLDT